MQYYSDMPSRSAIKAQQAFPILVAKANNQQVITYIDLAERLGYEKASAMGNILWPILMYCIKHELPCLCRLVISKATGRPGRPELMIFNLWAAMDPEVFDWDDFVLPTAKELQSAVNWADEEGYSSYPWETLFKKLKADGQLFRWQLT